MHTTSFLLVHCICLDDCDVLVLFGDAVGRRNCDDSVYQAHVGAILQAVGFRYFRSILLQRYR